MKRSSWPVVLAPIFCGAAAAALPASTATALSQAMRLAPGQWHSLITINSVDMRATPGRGPVSPAVEAALKAKIGRTFEADDCIGPTPADDGLVLPGLHIGAGCRYEDATARNGRMRLKAHCGDAASGFAADFTADGRYTSAATATTVETVTTARDAGYSVRMTMGIQSRRAGACPAR